MRGTAETLLDQGFQARRERRLAEARHHFAEAVDLCREVGDQRLLVSALSRSAQIERDQHHLDAAVELYAEAVAICRTLNEPLVLAHTVRHLADILRNQASWDLAAPHYQEALDIYRGHSQTPPLDLANAIRGFALLKANIGDAKEARQMWLEARGLYADVGVQAGVDEADKQIAHLRN